MRFKIALFVVSCLLAYLLADATKKLLLAEKQRDIAYRYIDQVAENCILVRKAHIIEDLQSYLNSQGYSRYQVGEVDNVCGLNTIRAINYFMFDQLAKPYMKAGTRE